MKVSIECKGIGKCYGKPSSSDSFWAVRDLSLKIELGAVTLLTGPSGSGKTTLLTMIGGLLQPTEGTLNVLGDPIENLSERERQKFRREKVGFIFQNYNLLDALTARENVGIALALKGGENSVAVDSLSRLGLGNKMDSYPSELSGGQRQRVAIGRALAGKSPILLADEPTAALDFAHGQKVMELIRREVIETGMTAIVVSHDMRIRKYADRIIEMEDGAVKRAFRPHKTVSVEEGD